MSRPMREPHEDDVALVVLVLSFPMSVRCFHGRRTVDEANDPIPKK